MLSLKRYFYFTDPSDVILRQGSSNTMYPLAVKMMFNYDAESNAMSILRAMSRETVPSRSVQQNFSKSDQQWLIGLSLFLAFIYCLEIVINYQMLTWH